MFQESAISTFQIAGHLTGTRCRWHTRFVVEEELEPFPMIWDPRMVLCPWNGKIFAESTSITVLLGLSRNRNRNGNHDYHYNASQNNAASYFPIPRRRRPRFCFRHGAWSRTGPHQFPPSSQNQTISTEQHSNPTKTVRHITTKVNLTTICKHAHTHKPSGTQFAQELQLGQELQRNNRATSTLEITHIL